MKKKYRKNQLIIFVSFIIIFLVIITIYISNIIKIHTYIVIPGIVINNNEIEIIVKKEEINNIKNNTSVIIDNKTYSYEIEKEIIDISKNYYQTTLNINKLNYNLLETKDIIIYQKKISIMKMIVKGVGLIEKTN